MMHIVFACPSFLSALFPSTPTCEVENQDPSLFSSWNWSSYAPERASPLLGGNGADDHENDATRNQQQWESHLSCMEGLFRFFSEFPQQQSSMILCCTSRNSTHFRTQTLHHRPAWPRSAGRTRIWPSAWSGSSCAGFECVVGPVLAASRRR